MIESTTFEWKRVKVSRAPKAQGESRPKAARWRALARRDWRKPLNATLKYRGGAEGWIEVRCRGQEGRYPGYTSLIEVLADMNSRTHD